MVNKTEMGASCIVGFVAFLASVSSIVGAAELAVVVVYFAELPPIFLVLSLVTGTFVFTLSSCIVVSITHMIRASVHRSGKIGACFALGSICIVTTLDLLLLLLQCHWILNQKLLTDIGTFQLQCLKSVTDISEGIFLLIMANSVTLVISCIALLLTCFWKIKKHPDVFQVSVLSSDWVYENSSAININNVSRTDTILTDHHFKQTRRFGNTHVQIPKINFLSKKSSISSNNQLLRNISTYCPATPEQPLQTFADVIAAISPETLRPSEKGLVRLKSFGPGDKEQLEPYEKPYNSIENELNESNCTYNNSSTLKCPSPKIISNSEDVSHWLTRGKWKRNTAKQKSSKRIHKAVRTPESDASTDEQVTPKRVKHPKIEITPPNEESINEAIHSLDSVLHLTPSVSTASYRHSPPYTSDSSPN